MTSTIVPPKSWITLLLALMLAEVASAFEVSMAFAALPTFYKMFNDPGLVGWVISAYLLMAAAASAICGRLGDLYGRSRVLNFMLILAAVGSLISALADTLEVIVFGRAIQGVAAAVTPLCFGLVRENFPREKIPLGIGVIAGTMATATGAGFVIGGLVIDYLTWHWMFYISTVTAVLGVLLVKLLLPPSPRLKVDVRLDYLGGLLFAPAVAGLLFALTKGASWGWMAPKTLCLAGISGGLLLFWLTYEWRHRNPLIDVRLFRNRQIALANLCYVLLALGAMQFALVLFSLLQQPAWTGVGLGVAATVAAMIKLPSSLVAIIASPWAGAVCGKRGARQALLYAMLFLTIGWSILTLHHSTIWIVTLAVMLNGIGTAIAFTAVPNLIVEVAPAERVSEVTGLSQVIRTTFMAVGAQVVASIFAAYTVSAPNISGNYPSSEAYELVFGGITLLCVLSLLVCLALPRRPPPPADRQQDQLSSGPIAKLANRT
ncbi:MULTISPECIES: MFS transporter [Pseudomonas]|uniref:MFS transporter n=1 Tax=Pseudomonas nitroreducens TaxID=46680 RepID=UPI001E61C823|nr:MULTISPECIES: MFS transporter [Pseudomonas]MCE4071511.1 MFS transporter [Pseudomonas nitritireducens]MCE4081287.1 MFS transporter [Pseudomonas nitroreducens]